MTITTAAEAAEYLFTVRPIKRKPGLERMRHFLELLGSPEKGGRFVHVAGTNGKGSVAAYLASILRASGYHTGLYISPHLKRVNERISIDGEEISDNDLVRLTNRVRSAAEEMEEPPSVFELLTALAFLYFREKGCDIAVLEVGLGGIRDCTNVIDPPEVAVITPIGLDHCAILGDTLPEIAANKAGIIKAGGRVAVYPCGEETDRVFRERAREVGAELRFAELNKVRLLSAGPEGVLADLGEIRGIHLPLAGAYQAKNAMLALLAVDFLRQQGWNIPEEAVRRGLESVRWPGRFEVLCRRPTVIVDGAHNPHGFAATAESLRRYFPGKKLILIMGIMEDKDYRGVLDLALPLASRILTVSPPSERALASEKLSALIRAEGVWSECVDTPLEAMRTAFRLAGEDGVICAFGSLYLVSDFREAAMLLQKERTEASSGGNMPEG